MPGVAFDGVSKPVTAGKSILVGSLGDVTGPVDAGEYAIVIAGGGVTGSSVKAGKSALVVSLGNVTSSVTATDGSVLILTLGNVTTTASASEIVAIIAIIAAGDVKVSVPHSPIVETYRATHPRLETDLSCHPPPTRRSELTKIYVEKTGSNGYQRAEFWGGILGPAVC